MKNKKILISSIVLIVIVIVGVICFTPKKPSYKSFTSTQNFYAEDYEEQFSKYEKDLDIQKGAEKIYINGVTKQGNIDIVLKDPNNKEYKFTITGKSKEEIEIKNVYGNWKYIINIYPDTDGSVTVSDEKINESQLSNNPFYK